MLPKVCLHPNAMPPLVKMLPGRLRDILPTVHALAKHTGCRDLRFAWSQRPLQPQRSYSTPSSDTFDVPVADVTIVGGGMVGAALAALLGTCHTPCMYAQHVGPAHMGAFAKSCLDVHIAAANPLTRSMRILLLDQQPQSFTWQAPAFPELRVSTITPATIRCFERAGAWPLVEQHSARFSTMQVWDTAGPGCIRWHASAAGHLHIGAVAENSLLQAALLGALRERGGVHTPSNVSSLRGADSLQPGITCLWPVKLEQLQLPPVAAGAAGAEAEAAPAAGSLAELVLQDGVRVRSRLVVAADGPMSRVRALAGLRTWGWPYHQRGVVATVKLQGGGTDTAWQRFLPTGPLALLPVRDQLANVVWSVTPSSAATHLETMGPKDFAAAVNQALRSPAATPSGSLGPGLAAVAQALSQAGAAGQDPFQQPPTVEAWVGSAPKSFPLQLKQSGRYARPRLALIGDAAHAVHPLAGQGVNLGFGDAEVLADVLARAAECGRDPGDAIMLQDEYERPRQKAVMTMTTALDTLQKVFAVQVAPLAAARNLGLGILNAAGPVKNEIMKYAMGL